MYQKAWDVVGYTADAGVWCTHCAELAYGPGVMRNDSEGNLVQPIFVSDLGQWECHCGLGDVNSGPHCNKCGEDVSA